MVEGVYSPCYGRIYSDSKSSNLCTVSQLQSPAFDPDWQKNGYLDQVVKLFLGWMEKFNLKGAKIDLMSETGRTPAIFIEVAGTESAKSDEYFILF